MRTMLDADLMLPVSDLRKLVTPASLKLLADLFETYADSEAIALMCDGCQLGYNRNAQFIISDTRVYKRDRYPNIECVSKVEELSDFYLPIEDSNPSLKMTYCKELDGEDHDIHVPLLADIEKGYVKSIDVLAPVFKNNAGRKEADKLFKDMFFY